MEDLIITFVLGMALWSVLACLAVGNILTARTVSTLSVEIELWYISFLQNVRFAPARQLFYSMLK